MRAATQGDVGSIMTALLVMLAKSPAPQMRYAEPTVAKLSVRRAISEGRGFFFGGYFVMVDVGSDWYTLYTYMIEQIILKVYPGDKSRSLQYVINEGLPKLAEHFNAHATVVGDTQIGYMTPLYHAAGYKTLGTQLMKERTNGLYPKDDRCPSTD